MPGPLDGIRILDLSQLASGPLATAILADQGADVIKVEQPGVGDLMRHMGTARGGISGIFAGLNRNKRSLALNLAQARGRELLEQLVTSADVFVHNFRPGVTERMGIGERHLRAVNERLIYVSISAFGEDGPYAQRKVFDSVIQVLAGFADLQSDASGEPQLISNIVCDKITALTVSQAITAALFGRDRGRGGQHVELNMLDASIGFLWPDGMGEQTLLDDAGHAAAPVRGSRMSLRRTADGYMTISGFTQREFEGICRAIGRPELIQDPRLIDPAARRRNIDYLEEIIDAYTGVRTIAEVSAVMQAEGVPHGHVNTQVTLPSDAQVAHNRLLVEVEHPKAGRMRLPRGVVRFGGEAGAIRRPPPGLGEHSSEILAELGISAAEIARLRADEVVA